MLLCAESRQGTNVAAVEQRFAVPLIDQETGEMLDCAVGRVFNARSGGRGSSEGDG